MVIGIVDRLILFFSFCGCAWFVWRYIASDLPDDFLTSAKKRTKKDKGDSYGGVCDNGQAGEREG